MYDFDALWTYELDVITGRTPNIFFNWDGSVQARLGSVTLENLCYHMICG